MVGNWVPYFGTSPIVNQMFWLPFLNDFQLGRGTTSDPESANAPIELLVDEAALSEYVGKPVPWSMTFSW